MQAPVEFVTELTEITGALELSRPHPWSWAAPQWG